MSPRLTPMRYRMRRSSGIPAMRFSTAACAASAARTAPAADANIASTESPAMSTMRPPCSSVWRRKSARFASSSASVARSSIPMRRENPTASAARIAASFCLMSVSATCPKVLRRDDSSRRGRVAIDSVKAGALVDSAALDMESLRQPGRLSRLSAAGIAHARGGQGSDGYVARVAARGGRCEIANTTRSTGDSPRGAAFDVRARASPTWRSAARP